VAYLRSQAWQTYSAGDDPRRCRFALQGQTADNCDGNLLSSQVIRLSISNCGFGSDLTSANSFDKSAGLLFSLSDELVFFQSAFGIPQLVDPRLRRIQWLWSNPTPWQWFSVS